MHSARRAERGFTLLELVVVIGIVLVVIALTIPLLVRGIEAARQTRCMANAREITTAINAFAAQNQSRLPENRTFISQSEYTTWRHALAETDLIPRGETWSCPARRAPDPRGEGGLQINGASCVGDIASSYALNGHVLWRRRPVDDDAVRPDTAILRPSHTILLAETNRIHPDLRASPPIVANYYGDEPGAYAYWHGSRGVYSFLDGHVEVMKFLETGSPDCRWHNGRDLSEDPFVPQIADEVSTHDHPDWAFLVPQVYR